MFKPLVFSHSIKTTLAGQLLLSTSQISEGIFHRSVIYMCGHDKEGAMGIVINKPMEGMTINDLLAQLQINIRMGDRKLPLMDGGPVGQHRGFLIHDGAFQQESAICTHDGITVTANANVLDAWLEGELPAKMMLALGYAGWTEGQLEKEIEEGSWISVPATRTTLFDTPDEFKWDVATAQLGFDLAHLHFAAGHA